MKVIGRIHGGNGAPQDHSSVTMHQGYMVQVFSDESASNPHGGITFFDISDPYEPALVAGHQNDDTVGLSEQHAMAYHSHNGRDYVALLAYGGVQIWDWTDVYNPQRISYLQLPGVTTGYARGAWWLSWQAPILYIGAASNGIFIVDTSDLDDPKMVNRDGPNPIPNNQTGGFRVGPVHAIGNLLVATSNDGQGYATFDISDPRNPALMDSILEGTPFSYSTVVNGHRIYAAETDDRLYVFDISDPEQITEIGFAKTRARGGYLSIQDGYAHIGASDYYAKVDVREENAQGWDAGWVYPVVGKATSGISGRDEDFAAVLGNLAVVSDDHGYGSFLIPHQRAPDTTGPVVNMVLPADEAINQSRTSRIGLTFSDQIDQGTVNEETIVVRQVGQDQISGRYSVQNGTVNFFPDEPLTGSRIYEIIIPANGVKDWAGNPIANEFRSTFSTGIFINAPISCTMEPIDGLEVGEVANFKVHVKSSMGAVHHIWDFGDGTPRTEPWRPDTISYRYEQPGHYTVHTTVGNDTYNTGCATLVMVHHPVVPGEAPSANTIAFDPKRLNVWNVNPDNDTVTAINAVKLEKRFEVPVGRRPQTLTLDHSGNAWVVSQEAATITVIEPEQGQVIRTIDLPYASQPYAILFRPDRSALYVTLQATGQVLRLDPGSGQITAQVEISGQPRGLALDQRGQRLFVTRYLSPSEQGEVVEINPDTWQIVQTLPLAMDPGPDGESSARGLPNALVSPQISPDGRRLWIPSKKDNILRGTLRDGQALTFDSTVRTIISQIDLVENREILAGRYDFNDRNMAVSARFSPVGNYVFVALQGSNAIDVLDAYNGRLVTAIEDAGLAPQGMAFTSDGGQLFVHSLLSRSVQVYDVRDIIYPGRDQTADFVAEISTVEQEQLTEPVLMGKRIFYNAKDPRMNRDGYVSCATCHLEGGHDGRVWDRAAQGEGLRNTLSLQSQPGVSGTQPWGDQHQLHWSGNFDEIQDFEHDIRELFGGTGFIDDAVWNSGTYSQALGDAKAGLAPELDSLAAYIASLREGARSPYRNADGTLTSDGIAGQTLFNRLGCADCHGGPYFSDSGSGLMHDVGTLKPTSGQRAGQPLVGLDTPTLWGLWQSAPYLHDGSAETLFDVLISQNENGRHGNLSTIQETDPQALFQLVSYLLQIDALEAAAPINPPTAVIARPKADSVFRLGDVISIAADTRTSLARPVEKVIFYADDLPLGEDIRPMYNWRWKDAAVGRHELRVQVIYKNGGGTLSSSVLIEVIE